MAVISERFDDLGKRDPDRIYRLGILGGTFDPIHVGHLACADEVRDGFGLDAVIFIPTAHPVFKRNQQIAPALERFKMCRLATADNPSFDVSAIEIERGGDTYTVDTLRALRRHYPANVEIFFIAGVDAISTITKWKDSEALGGMARFIAVSRPDFDLSDEQKCRLMRNESNIDVSFLEITALAISSSGIRERIGQGKSVRYLVPAAVDEHVKSNGLYRYNRKVDHER